MVSGPKVDLYLLEMTDANGQISGGYVGNGGIGVDIIQAHFDGDTQWAANPGIKFWDYDCNGNAIPDTCDVDCNAFDGHCLAYADCGLSLDANGDDLPDDCS